MAYQIRCDEFILDDVRDDSLTVLNPVVDLEENAAGGCTFTIHKNHPYYGKMKSKKSVFEVSDEIGVIFRGRMTDNTTDFYNSKSVDLEGALTYFNDSTVRPYSFPADWSEDAEYLAAAESGNVVEFFLKWLISQHNAQVEEFQRFKLGSVTVVDNTGNNYISRSDSSYPTTWEVLKSKLFGSALGGKLCIRYEPDGNYIDYLSEYPLTNTQEIVFGENLLNLKCGSDSSATYSVVLPLGATIEDEAETGGEKKRLTIESLADGDISEDIVKEGDIIYSRSAVEAFGRVCAPVKETTWDDVAEPGNLRTKAVTALVTNLMLVSSTIEVTALDLHFTDAQIKSFRFYRNVKVRTEPHSHNGTYQLPKLSLNLHSPQNTKITVGTTARTLTDINTQKESETVQRIESAEKDIAESREQVSEVKNQLLIQQTQIMNDCEQIIMSALESYVETGNYEEFRSTVQAQLAIMAEEISMKFSSTTEYIEDVNGDLQEKFTELYKYISFSEEGITIGGSESGVTLNLDNDGIAFSKNGVPFGRWDGNDFYTGNIVVEVNERAQFGNFAFVPRSDGSLSFLKVGG